MFVHGELLNIGFYFFASFEAILTALLFYIPVVPNMVDVVVVDPLPIVLSKVVECDKNYEIFTV